MNKEALRQLLQLVAAGKTPVPEAIDQLATLPFKEAAQTLADTHRQIRVGLPEVVFARHKTAEQVSEGIGALYQAHGCAMATHVTAEMASVLSGSFAKARYDRVSRIFSIGQMPVQESNGFVAVVSAGTSDLFVAEEAAQTVEFAGHEVARVYDVGVAGLHRLLNRLDVLRQCKVIICIAGMEGALPGVVAGLVPQPVVAVPTSVGYGASFEGLSALLAMLNACSNGIGVVNIDNGFGAAVLALRILNQ